MLKAFKSYINIWYIPVIIAGILGVIGLFTISIYNEIIVYCSLGLPFIALVISLLLGLHKLYKKQWLLGTLQIITTSLIGGAGLFIIGIYFIFYPYDFFASNLELPDNIKLYVPKDEIIETCESVNQFELYKTPEPGIYNYKLCVTGLGKGSTYIKAYEVTHNYALSGYYIMEASYKPVKYENKVFTDIGLITIYEGDWGEPYAARFEVWFKPSDGSEERKIFEKTYKIEGWQR